MEYLRSVWAALVPVQAASAHEHADLEAHWCGGEQGVVLVTNAADVRVQVRPLLRASDIGDAVNAV
jgi:hypothetical protein